VARLEPFHRTTELVSNFVPVTVRVKLAPPATVFVGDMRVTVGAGFAMVNVRAFEVPPPGLELKTTTLAVPGATMSVAGTEAVNWVALTKVVVSAVPFHIMVDAFTKLLPVTVKVKAAVPAVRLRGDNEPATGTGFLTVKETEPDVPPPGAGLDTVTGTVPVAAISLAGTAA